MENNIFSFEDTDSGGSGSQIIPQESSLNAYKVLKDFNDNIAALEASITTRDDTDLKQLAGTLEKNLDSAQLQLTEDSIQLNGQHPGLKFPSIQAVTQVVRKETSETMQLYYPKPQPPAQPVGSPPSSPPTNAQVMAYAKALNDYNVALVKYNKDFSEMLDRVVGLIVKPAQPILQPATNKKQKTAQATEIEWLENSVLSALNSGIRTVTMADFSPFQPLPDKPGTSLTDIQNRLITNVDDGIRHSGLFPDVINFTFVDNMKQLITLELANQVFGGTPSSPPANTTSSPPNGENIAVLTERELNTKLAKALDIVFNRMGEMGAQGASLSYAEFQEKAADTSAYITNLMSFVKQYDKVVASAAQSTLAAGQSITTARTKQELFQEKFAEMSVIMSAAAGNNEGTPEYNQLINNRIQSVTSLVEHLVPEGSDSGSNSKNITNAELYGVQAASSVAGLNVTSSTLQADVNEASKSAASILNNAATDFTKANQQVVTAMKAYVKSVADYVTAQYQWDITDQMQNAEIDSLVAIEKIING